VTVATARALAHAAADWTCAHLQDKPRSVLAVPTGSTPQGLYSELAARSRNGALKLDKARFFNLDEFCSLSQSDPHSYASFLEHHLITPLGLREDQVRLLRGDAVDLDGECRAYDAELADCGGIDLCFLGLGANGHVAFNEPGSAWDSTTHVAQLSPATRAAAARQMGSAWQVPTLGITMGIKTLSQSRHILLLIAGARKEAARAAVHGGTPDINWPVTSLLAHPNITIIELCASNERP
jgi:glucosamine-6-phosphate deaminase